MPDSLMITTGDVKAATSRLVQAAQFCGQQETAGPFTAWLKQHYSPANVPQPDELRGALSEAALFVTAAAIWLTDHPEALPGIAAQMIQVLDNVLPAGPGG